MDYRFADTMTECKRIDKLNALKNPETSGTMCGS